MAAPVSVIAGLSDPVTYFIQCIGSSIYENSTFAEPQTQKIITARLLRNRVSLSRLILASMVMSPFLRQHKCPPANRLTQISMRYFNTDVFALEI
jgi:hypothetical protein